MQEIVIKKNKFTLNGYKGMYFHYRNFLKIQKNKEEKYQQQTCTER